MFTADQVRQINAVAKEVFGNILAAALNLPVPQWALVRFTPDFLDTLSDDARIRNEQCQRGLRFQYRYHEGYTILGIS